MFPLNRYRSIVVEEEPYLLEPVRYLHLNPLRAKVLADLRAGRRTWAVRRARRLLSQLAVRHLGYSGASVARFLGVTTSAVNRAAWSEPIPGAAEVV